MSGPAARAEPPFPLGWHLTKCNGSALSTKRDLEAALAGCDDLKGLDYDRISGLLFDALRTGKHRDLVFSTLPSWFRKWHEQLRTDRWSTSS